MSEIFNREKYVCMLQLPNMDRRFVPIKSLKFVLNRKDKLWHHFPSMSFACSWTMCGGEAMGSSCSAGSVPAAWKNYSNIHMKKNVKLFDQFLKNNQQSQRWIVKKKQDFIAILSLWIIQGKLESNNVRLVTDIWIKYKNMLFMFFFTQHLATEQKTDSHHLHNHQPHQKNIDLIKQRLY